MQNQIVSFTVKSLLPALPGHISKGMSSLSQQRYVTSCLPNDMCVREFSERRSTPLLLPGGGLEKFQGRFKEEQYFNTNDHLLLARIRQTGYRLKCEKEASDWAEFERMATACTKVIAQRQTDMLNKNRSTAEESFFLQEQKSLLERILEVLKRLTFNRRGPPYGHGSPFGPYYHNHYGSPFQPEMRKRNLDDDDAKKDDESLQEKGEESNSDQVEQGSKSHPEPEMKASENHEEEKNDAVNDEDWYNEHDRDDHDDRGDNGEK